MPSYAPVIEAEKGEKLIDVVSRSGLVKSKTEFRRLIKERAITILK